MTQLDQERRDDGESSNTGDTEPRVGLGYVAHQLSRSLRAASTHTDPVLRDKAEHRAKSLLSVLEHLASGSLRLGHRQPYDDVPTWVTPEVTRGGFASGQYAAGGAWRAHEIALARRIGVEPTGARSALNGHQLTHEGLSHLMSQLELGTYRIDVPEEGALLTVGWLLDRGEFAAAGNLIDTVAPLFDRLRFFPRSAPTPLTEATAGIGTPVLVRSAHSIAEGLAKKLPSKDVEAMREHYQVWAPLTDALVSLMLETVEGDPPQFVGEGPTRTVTGGMPFSRFPEDFETRRAALLEQVSVARARHRHCRRVHRTNEVLGLFTQSLQAFPDLDAAGRQSAAARVRHRLAGFVTAHGLPGTAGHQALRGAQVAGPSHAQIAHLVSKRIHALTEPGEGLEDVAMAAATQPVTSEEQSADVPPGSCVPGCLTERLAVAQATPLEKLIQRRIVSSGEVLAMLLPQLTGPALATRFSEPPARRLYAASYRAFRQRRSLLLLWLQRQVSFSELPWIVELEARGTSDPLPAVQEALRQTSALAIQAFPATITPNKLVSELSTLAKVALPAASANPRTSGDDHRPSLPLVEEIAADIFMGTFSVKFLRAAQLAVRLLLAQPGGSLYLRYYGIDSDRVLALDRIEEQWSVRTCPDFDGYCVELAALPEGGNSVARNGAIIEQASILTTHNLAVLVDALQLQPLLAGSWGGLAERAYESVLDRLERRVMPESIHRIQRMRASKTLAFGWRQMIFFASFLEPSAQHTFVATCKERLAARRLSVRERFTPVLLGLERTVSGDTMPREASHSEVSGSRRLLGWSVGTPFLMGFPCKAS